MLIYLVVIPISFVLGLYAVKDYDSIIRKSALFLLVIFLCAGYMTGTDWRVYELFYNNANFSSLGNYNKELGYYYFTAFFNLLHINFWVFLIAIKVIVFLILINFINTYKVSLFLFLGLFLPETGYYLFIDNPLRNFIAIAIWLYSTRYIFSRKLVPYLILTLIATLFHISAIIMIPLYYISRINIKPWLVIVLFIIFSITADKVQMTLQFVDMIANNSQLIANRIATYTNTSDFRAINISGIQKFVLLLIIIFFRKDIKTNLPHGQEVLNISYFYFILYPYCITTAMFQRFIHFEIFFVFVALAYILYNCKKNLLKHSLITLLFLMSLLKTYTVITYDYRYVPYSNYFYYALKGDMPSYHIRSNFNKINSPYKNKHQ